MAQAARQSLRMQKELKLLISDPPYGVSFPFISDSSFNLTSIDADIEGPEGTVYAKGIFRLNIQIPERYPFQPPIVTFVTPIYHPNIDTGGRICLDILNLPPKGAWQPSLNISTVLASIGLLLSEPNPDDGLMCEASREFKYNKHTFDEKARSMTEKFARAGVYGDGSCSKISQAQSSTNKVESNGSDLSKCGLDKDFASDKKLCEIDMGFASDKKFNVNGSKLSLGNKPQQNKDFDVGGNQKPIDKIERLKEPCRELVEEHHQHNKNLSWTKRKLSLGSLGSSEQNVDNEKEAFRKTQNLSSLNSLSVEPREVISCYNERLPRRDSDMAITPNPQVPPKGVSDRTEDHFSLSKRKKLGLTSKRLSLGLSGSSQAQHTEDKENSDPSKISSVSSTTQGLLLNNNHSHLAMNFSKNMGGNANFGTKHESMGKLQGGNGEKVQEMEGSILPESVIVLDSEDSEEETKGSLRSRLLVGRKRLAGQSKRNVKC